MLPNAPRSFQPGDIFLLYGGDNPFDRLEKWALGSPFVHCMICLAELYLSGYPDETRKSNTVHLIIESTGEGVTLGTLLSYKRRHLRVLRWKGPDQAEVGRKAAHAAYLISLNPQSNYDYLAITEWVLPRLICQKLGLPVPLSWHRNRYFLCSELVAEAYLDAGYPIVPGDIVPLPGDFAESAKLQNLGDITL